MPADTTAHRPAYTYDTNGNRATDITNLSNPQILGTLLSPDDGAAGPQSGPF
jgi:hypothetical protein